MGSCDDTRLGGTITYGEWKRVMDEAEDRLARLKYKRLYGGYSGSTPEES